AALVGPAGVGRDRRPRRGLGGGRLPGGAAAGAPRPLSRSAYPRPDPMTPQRLDTAYRTAVAALLAERTPDGHWVGELATSALSTATAVSALALVSRDAHAGLVERGVAWLAA